MYGTRAAEVGPGARCRRDEGAAKAVNGTSGLIEGNTSQFLWQCAAAGITAVYSFVVTFFILKAVNGFTPVRVPDEVEERGLDEALHGEKAYDLVG